MKTLEQALIQAFYEAEGAGDIEPYTAAEWGYDYIDLNGNCPAVEERVRTIMGMDDVLFNGAEWKLFCKIGKECAKGLHRSRLHKVLA